jgi:histidine phosphotransferase ChpT
MSKNHNLTLAGPDLAALLCSRVCHDIISPVGAINNGLELLDEGGADADAMDLIRTSALNASVRLKFARLAFGASGSVGASIDTGEAEKAVIDYVSADKKTEVTWSGPRAIIPKNQVKLLLNLFLVAYGAIPRGGQIDVVIETPRPIRGSGWSARARWCGCRPSSSRSIRAISRRRSMPTRSSPTTRCCSPKNQG